MKEYEIMIESITPCGGSKHARREFTEVAAESPMEYVERNKMYPIMEVTEEKSGDVLITTGNEVGYKICYRFTEI